MPGRAGSQRSELQKEPETRTSTGTRNSQRVDYVRKAPKYQKEPELSRHRKFDSSGRYPGSSTSGRRRIQRVEDRCEIGDRNRHPLRGVQDVEPGAGSSCGECSQGVEPEGPRGEEPKCPISLKLSLRGSGETQAQHRLDRLGEPWDRSV
jgi:hypothetical protein